MWIKSEICCLFPIYEKKTSFKSMNNIFCHKYQVNSSLFRYIKQSAKVCNNINKMNSYYCHFVINVCKRDAVVFRKLLIFQHEEVDAEQLQKLLNEIILKGLLYTCLYNI